MHVLEGAIRQAAVKGVNGRAVTEEEKENFKIKPRGRKWDMKAWQAKHMPVCVCVCGLGVGVDGQGIMQHPSL